MGDQRASNELNSENLVVFLYRHRKPLITISFLGAVVAAVISLMIQNKYESKVVMFPTSTNTISKALIGESSPNQAGLLEFGEEEQAEQMLQILNSDEIRDRITKKYDLGRHYDIEPDDEFRKTKLQKEYESNINFKRTEFMSVEITVLDHDPDTAALIANDIAALMDSVRNRMRKEVAVPALQIVEEEYVGMQNYIKGLEDSLNVLRSYGVTDYESQTEVFNDQLAIAISKNNTKAVKALEQKLEVLQKYGGAYVSIRDYLEYLKKQQSFLRSKYQEAKVDAERELESKFIVNNAYPAEKKSYPIRWLIVVISTVATFLLTLFFLLIRDSLKEVRAQYE